MQSYWQELCIVFCAFEKELWPLIDVRISFPLIIYKRTTKCCICTDIDNIWWFVCKIAGELWPLVDVDWDFYAHLAFYSMKSAASRSSGNSSLHWLSCASVNWCIVVTCSERTDLLALVCDVYLWSCHSWVRCGAWSYRFLIFALFLTFLFL